MPDARLYSEILTALLESLPASSFVFLLTPEGVYKEVVSYPDIRRLTLRPSDHPGKRIEEVVPEPLSKPARCYFDQAVREKKSLSYCYPHFNKNRWWMCRNIIPIVHAGTVVDVVMEVYDCSPPTRVPKNFAVIDL